MSMRGRTRLAQYRLRYLKWKFAAVLVVYLSQAVLLVYVDPPLALLVLPAILLNFYFWSGTVKQFSASHRVSLNVIRRQYGMEEL